MATNKLMEAAAEILASSKSSAPGMPMPKLQHDTPGNSGTAPGASLTYPITQFIVGGNYSNGGSGGAGGGFFMCGEFASRQPGTPGVGGALVIFENTGT